VTEKRRAGGKIGELEKLKISKWGRVEGPEDIGEKRKGVLR